MRHFELSGTPAEIGEAFGEACRGEISGLYQVRMKNAIEQALAYGGRTITEPQVIDIARRCLPVLEVWAPDGYAELAGIARGANRPLEQIWAMNALTDIRDVAAWGDRATWSEVEGDGCSAFVVAKDRAAGGRPLVGQTWDLATDNLPFVVTVRRRPKHGPGTRTLTTVGCLSLIGINDENVAVGTTNIRTLDAGIGVGYLDVIHAALAETSLSAAIDRIVEAPRAGAHFFYLMDGEGAAAAVECSAKTAHVQHVTGGTYVHCNHVLEAENLPLEAQGTPVASSHHRQTRMEVLLASDRLVSREDMFAALADHEGAPNSICRHDYGGITSNAGVVMSPIDGGLWVVHGPPCEGEWREISA